MFTVNLTGETFYYHTPEVFRYVEASMRFDYSGYSIANYSILNEVIHLEAQHPGGKISRDSDAETDIGSEHSIELTFISDTQVNAITAWYTFAPVGANVNNPDVCVIYQWELSITSVE